MTWTASRGRKRTDLYGLRTGKWRKEGGMEDKRKTYRNKFPVPAGGTLSERSEGI